MRNIVVVMVLLIGSPALAQTLAPPTPMFSPGVSPAAPTTTPPKPKSFLRDDGQPNDKTLLQASRSCHAHNPDAASAKDNCAVFDNQIDKRNIPNN